MTHRRYIYVQSVREMTVSETVLTPQKSDYTDEHGTRDFSGLDFDGYLAKAGHAMIRKGDARIFFNDASEIREMAEMLLGMLQAAQTKE